MPHSDRISPGFRGIQDVAPAKLCRFQLGPKNQTSHQFRPRELFPALGTGVGLRVLARQAHAQQGHRDQSAVRFANVSMC